jgi:hypothetical protein
MNTIIFGGVQMGKNRRHFTKEFKVEAVRLPYYRNEGFRNAAISLPFLLIEDLRWWAQQGLNLWLLPCEGKALPLSYAPDTEAFLLILFDKILFSAICRFAIKY